MLFEVAVRGPFGGFVLAEHSLVQIDLFRCVRDWALKAMEMNQV